MKTLVQHIYEALNSLEIVNLDAELNANQISKTRFKEVKNFFENILGTGTLYCVNPNNKSDWDMLMNGKQKYEIKFVNPLEILSFEEFKERWPSTDEDKQKAEYEDCLAFWKKHNENAKKANADVQQIVDEHPELASILDKKIKGVSFGTKSNSAIAFSPIILNYKGAWIAGILQEEYAKRGKWQGAKTGGCRIYVSKDSIVNIDNK